MFYVLFVRLIMTMSLKILTLKLKERHLIRMYKNKLIKEIIHNFEKLKTILRFGDMYRGQFGTTTAERIKIWMSRKIAVIN